MADRRSARGKQDLTPDELAPGADEQPGALTIVGILGEGTDTGTVRLFLDAQFQTYYEIPSDAILRRTRVPAERSPLGVDCSAVVVGKGTELVVHRASTRRVEEEFLAGDFTAPGSFAPAPPTGGGPHISIGCPSENDICVSGVVGCSLRSFDLRCVFTEDWRCRPITIDLRTCRPPTRANSWCCIVSDPCVTGGPRCEPITYECVTIDCGFGGFGGFDRG